MSMSIASSKCSVPLAIEFTENIENRYLGDVFFVDGEQTYAPLNAGIVPDDFGMLSWEEGREQGRYKGLSQASTAARCDSDERACWKPSTFKVCKTAALFSRGFYHKVRWAPCSAAFNSEGSNIRDGQQGSN